MIEGILTALVTPFNSEPKEWPSIDYASLEKLVMWQLECGVSGFVVAGTTGESATLSAEEKLSLIKYVVGLVKGRVPVVAGTGSNNTKQTIELTRAAKEAGADAALIVCPYYNKPTQEGLYRHYEYLAKKVDIPFVLYNVPGRTGVSIAPETVARLSKISNIVAIKEASGNLDLVSQILSLCSITVLSGEDSLTMPMMAIGAQGSISVTANVVPDLNRRMIHASLDGDVEEAQELHYQLFSLSKVLFVETNPIPVKTALAMMGKIKEEFRLPLCEISKENREKVRKILIELGVVSSKKKVKV